MKNTVLLLERLPRKFEQLRRDLGRVGYISRGSVQDRTARTGGGAGYQWTRKVGQKTITVALTPVQFERLKEAVANHRRLRKITGRMEAISRQIIFQSNPHPARRKRLSKKVLGLI